ncbi:MAG: LysM peptidoglycan-binding domain-containing protein [Caldilineaceae bacterium]
MNWSILRTWTQNPRYRRWSIVASALLIGVALFSLSSAARTSASDVNVLANGNFEDGFAAQPGCGMVGIGWNCFTNGGGANYGFYQEQWGPVVANGASSQLIEINTRGSMHPDHDRYAGIYQTVPVVDWAEYTLDMKGIIRTTEMDGDPWRYRVQVGWTQGKNADWSKVTNWQDVGWDTYYAQSSPGTFSSYNRKLMAEDDYLTVYIRVWKKWGTAEVELNVNFDAISLTGPSAGSKPAATATATAKPGQPPAPTATATTATVASCGGQNFVANGDFEGGFNTTTIGHVGKSWGWFTNGGAANYGFYDEQWPPVVSDGSHGQLIEINSKGVYPADADRYAGIYQKISGLKPGATYQLTVKGQLRGVNGGPDANAFAAQWGFASGSEADWAKVNNWQILDLGPTYDRTAPGPMGTATVKFTAPASDIVVFLQGWKKWGTTETEMDLNLDSISLTGCTTTTTTPPSTSCTYVVKPGNSLAWIAQQYGVSVQGLAAANSIYNVNIIYVGQVLTIPGCAVAPAPTPTPAPAATATPTPTPGMTPMTYTVKPGDSLSAIAAHFGVNVYDLAQANSIWNINIIYVGQVLVIPGD